MCFSLEDGSEIWYAVYSLNLCHSKLPREVGVPMNIAIVDDEQQQIDRLSGYIKEFHQKAGKEFTLATFRDPLLFIETYKPAYDIIFLDVEMPLMDGISLARKLRQSDDETILIYVTKMAQYAIHGYEVGAMDYILKPVSYFDFAMKYRRAVKAAQQKMDKEFIIRKAGGFIKVNIGDIRYVEVSGRICTYHTTDGDYEGYATLKSVKEKLDDAHFLLCNGYCLVNPRYIKRIDGYVLLIGDDELSISRPKKKEFMQELNDWIGKYSI